jgi:hypothetical protein
MLRAPLEGPKTQGISNPFDRGAMESESEQSGKAGEAPGAEYGSKVDPGPRGPRGGSQATRHVHRRRARRHGPAPPRVGSGRQRRRRTPRGPLRSHLAHHPRRRFDHGGRQRPRHPRRHARKGRERRRSRHDRAPRRRQVRQRQLQSLRRSARRRRQRRERRQRVAASSRSSARARPGTRSTPRRSQGPINAIGKTDRTGTKVTFKPDTKIFTKTDFSFEILNNRLREISFLNAGLMITLSDERADKKVDYQFEGGIQEFVEHAQQEQRPRFTTTSSTCIESATSRS